MPYITRDKDGNIIRATLQPLHGLEMISYDHPDVVAFLQKNGQDPAVVTESLNELRRTDGEMARAVEDVVTALLKKNLLKMSDLPKPVQERMAFRVKLRMMIQETFDKASNNTSASDAHAPTTNWQPPRY